MKMDSNVTKGYANEKMFGAAALEPQFPNSMPHHLRGLQFSLMILFPEFQKTHFSVFQIQNKQLAIVYQFNFVPRISSSRTKSR